MSTLNQKVLLLNGDFRPIGVIDVVRAFLLVWKDCARMESDVTTYTLRSQHATHEVSSVIHLVHYIDVRKRRRESGKQRFRIFVRDRFRCQYCCKRFSPQELTLDHIIPRSKNGSDDPENLAASCYPCNQRKGNRTPDEARMPLLATPSALKYGLDKAMLRHYAEMNPSWLPYLCLDRAGKVA